MHVCKLVNSWVQQQGNGAYPKTCKRNRRENKNLQEKERGEKEQSNSSSKWKFCFEDCDLGNTLKKKKARIGKFESLYYWQLPLYIIWTLHATGHLFRVFLFTLLLGTRSWNPGHSCLDIHVKILITLWYLYLHICLCLYLWASFLFFLCPFFFILNSS